MNEIKSVVNSNASTLDTISNKVSVLENKNIIQAEMTANWNISSNNTYVKVPFNSTSLKIGSNLSNSSGVITIGEGISTVKVISRLGVVKSSAGNVFLKISKISGGVETYIVANQYGVASQRSGISVEHYMSVAEGDTIKIETYGSTSDVITRDALISYFIVEAIN